jgi:hypothetical protein
MWRKRLGSLLFKTSCALLVGLISMELLLHVFMPSTPDYGEVIAQSLEHPERLYPAKQTSTYDIHGLYDQASLVTLRISPNRFIEPEPEPAHYRVLFLGGSTTESWFMEEAQRWVARLNVPGLIATYNAAQSGAGTLDEYYTFVYLRDRGFTFDLVVLMTMVNDFMWQRRLAKFGAQYQPESYREGLKAWYVDQQPQSWLDNFKTITLARKVISGLKAQKQSSVQSWALAYYVQQQRDAVSGKRLIGLDQCKIYRSDLQQFMLNEHKNLGLLADVVKPTGAKFLVMSEATSFLAPSTSFKIDIRFTPDCGSDSIFTNEAAYRLFTELNGLYLNAARDVGAFTFDLAGKLAPYTNGPNGGRYVYDAVHFTPEGAALVAETLRPVLSSMLTPGAM